MNNSQQGNKNKPLFVFLQKLYIHLLNKVHHIFYDELIPNFDL